MEALELLQIGKKKDREAAKTRIVAERAKVAENEHQRQTAIESIGKIVTAIFEENIPRLTTPVLLHGRFRSQAETRAILLTDAIDRPTVEQVIKVREERNLPAWETECEPIFPTSAVLLPNLEYATHARENNTRVSERTTYSRNGKSVVKTHPYHLWDHDSSYIMPEYGVIQLDKYALKPLAELTQPEFTLKSLVDAVNCDFNGEYHLTDLCVNLDKELGVSFQHQPMHNM